MRDEPDLDPSAHEPRRSITLHLAHVDVWLRQVRSGTYVPEAFGQEGFIHCTDGLDRAIEVGNRYYQGDPRQYCLLVIECAKVMAPIVYEDAKRVYPHIYGPLNTDAVTNVLAVERDPDGRFVRFGLQLTNE